MIWSHLVAFLVPKSCGELWTFFELTVGRGDASAERGGCLGKLGYHPLVISKFINAAWQLDFFQKVGGIKCS